MKREVEELRKAGVALHIAVDATVALDIQRRIEAVVALVDTQPVRPDKRKWECRPIRVFDNTDGDHGIWDETRDEKPKHVFTFQSFRMVDESRNGSGMLEVSAGGYTPAAAFRKMRELVRAEYRSGKYTRYEDYLP